MNNELEIKSFKSDKVIERCNMLLKMLNDMYENIDTLKTKATNYNTSMKDNISNKTIETVSKFYNILDEIKEQLDDRLNKANIGAANFKSIEEMD